ncbi:OmpA family protein [Rufibacter roseus]|uniref:OmpA family protein n=1 Tax=Rufibacter roseus TaxID=1567108 RepID=A0ABW2DRP8_9BACT|nr:OmpA family protein [Rufibacter roseus]
MKNLQILTAFLFPVFLFSCSDTGQRIENADSVSEMATVDTAVWFDDDRVWENVDFEGPIREEPELAGADVTVRGNDTVTIYQANEDILFDLDKAQLRDAGVEKLQKIAENIKNTTNGLGKIRVMGFTDSLASKAYNRDLGRERAKAVEDWLTSNGGFDSNRIRVISKGEQNPVETNATAEGRQQNRRVEIVVVRMPQSS